MFKNEATGETITPIKKKLVIPKEEVPEIKKAVKKKAIADKVEGEIEDGVEEEGGDEEPEESTEEEEPTEMEVVLSELPQVPARQIRLNDGKVYPVITIEEALGKIIHKMTLLESKTEEILKLAK